MNAIQESMHVTHVGGPRSFDMLRSTFVRQRFAPHVHDFFAIGAIERGAARTRFGAGEVVHTQGEVVVISPNQVHTGEPVDAEGWSYRMFYLPVSLVAACTPEGIAPHFSRSSYADRPMAARLIAAHAALEVGTDVLRQESILTELLCDINARFRDDRGSEAPRVPSGAMSRVREYLGEHYAQSVCLADLSKVAGVSSFHLIRIFRRTYGLPPYAYLALIRVNRAKEMLEQGARVSDVAFSTGFSDQSHLTRHFKRVFGFQPGRYSRSCVGTPMRAPRVRSPA